MPITATTTTTAVPGAPLPLQISIPTDVTPVEGDYTELCAVAEQLGTESQGGFSPQAAYIFKKQLEEADLIVINRIDELSTDEADVLAGLLQTQYAGTPVLRMSAKTGNGFDALVEMLDQRGRFGQRIMDVDYDTYAVGEAELGWLNSSLSVSAPGQFNLDELLAAISSCLSPSS